MRFLSSQLFVAVFFVLIGFRFLLAEGFEFAPSALIGLGSVLLYCEYALVPASDASAKPRKPSAASRIVSLLTLCVTAAVMGYALVTVPLPEGGQHIDKPGSVVALAR